jgi:hypothetical protein
VLGAGGFSSSELEAARADAVLTQRFGFDPGTLLVVYEDPQGHLLATDPRFQADVEASVAGLRSLPEVADVISPALNPRQLTPDRHAAYVVVTLHVVPADPHPLLNTVTQALRPTELSPTLKSAAESTVMGGMQRASVDMDTVAEAARGARRTPLMKHTSLRRCAQATSWPSSP